MKALTDDGKHIGKAYTITGPEALSYSRVAEILSNVTGRVCQGYLVLWDGKQKYHELLHRIDVLRCMANI